MIWRELKMLLWIVLVLDLGVSAVTLPKITDENFIAECVKEHNKARSAVSPPANNMLYMVGPAHHTVFHCQERRTDWWLYRMSLIKLKFGCNQMEKSEKTL